MIYIPVYNRPQFLKIFLDRLAHVTRFDDFQYLFVIDQSDKVIEVTGIITRWVNTLGITHEIIKLNNPRKNLGKQPYAILTGYNAAAKHDDTLTFMLEPDILIHEKFFDWHLAIHHKHPEIACSMGAITTLQDIPMLPLNFYYIADNEYQSWGVCWKTEALKRYVLPHAKKAYFNNPERYIKQNFPNTPPKYYEQLGLIKRIVQKHKLKIAWPCYPLCYHFGYYSYNRGYKRKGDNPLDIIYDPLKLKQCGNPVNYEEQVKFAREVSRVQLSGNIGILKKCLHQCPMKRKTSF